MDKVFAAKVENYKDSALETAIEKIFCGIPQLNDLSAGKKVLLKPNLVAKATPEKAVTTHPDFICAVIHALKKRGVTDIILADSCGGMAGQSVMAGIYKASGMTQLCKTENISLYTQPQSAIVKSPNGKLVHEFTVMQICTQVDLIINLPKLKTHVMTGLSAATKNLYGTIPGLMKAELHMRFPERESFGDMLVDLNLVHQNVVSIIDGITAMQGDGPSGGTPYNAGLIIASANRYLADLACCVLVDIPPVRVPYLNAAILRNICPAEYSPQFMASGANYIQPLQNFEKPKSFLGFDFSGKYPRALRWASPLVTKICAPKPNIQHRKCIGCGKCAEICPQQVITLKNKKAYIAPQNCIRCFCCHEMCPAKAIKVQRIKIFNL